MSDRRLIMDRLPSNITFDIFSRLPGRCLARSRCVSKVWCEYIDDRYLTKVYDERVPQEPIPILYHADVDRKLTDHGLCFHMIESKQTETGTADHTYVLEPKEDPWSEFFRKQPLTQSFSTADEDIELRGSCNGLMCLSQTEDGIVTTLVVVHPLRKECYELPTLLMCRNRDGSGFQESCGLGFDASTNTLKMVCVLFKEYPRQNHDMLRKSLETINGKDLCTMVHDFGTNTWREIPQVPDYTIEGNSVFVNGCLHWLVSDDKIIKIYDGTGGRPVIWFDVEKEEFGVIDPPKRMYDERKSYNYWGDDHLVDLNGEVGYVCFRTQGVWILKQKEWVPHWQFGIVPDGCLEVLGCWNKDGDILVRNYNHGMYTFFVYNLRSGVLHKTGPVLPFKPCEVNIFMHPNKLFSIRGIGENSSPMRETGVKASCEWLFPKSRKTGSLTVVFL